MKKLLIGLCILLMLGMVGWRLTRGNRAEARATDLLLRSSNAQEFTHNITVLGDEWLGYMVFRSRAFQEALAAEGIGITFRVEHSFEERFRQLASGEADLVLATADSYLANGAQTRYPGVISLVIDESFGGDALIAREGITTIDDLNAPEIQGALVGHSPSEFLLKSQIAHFQLDALAPRLPSFRRDTAEDAYRALTSGEVDFAVLWEPYRSRALQNRATCLIDTAQARDLIVDVAVASRVLAAQQPDLLESILTCYLRTLTDLQSDPDRLLQQATIDSGEPQPVAQQMLQGIRFTDYASNTGAWLGGEHKMEQTLTSLSRILQASGDLTTAPVPASLLHSAALTRIAQDRALVSTLQRGASASLGHYFRPLSDASWAQLSQHVTGTLLNQPIEFAAGSSEIDPAFQQALLRATAKLQHYPYHRLLVQAHVSPGGGPEVEQQLSQQRADIIRTYLLRNTDLVSERIHAVGLGATQAVTRKAGESSRAWKRRCRRAQVLIAAE